MFLNFGIDDYVIIVGDPSLSVQYMYDEYDSTLYLRCCDMYESLPEKIVVMSRAVKELFDPEYIVKMDDDVVLQDISELRLRWVEL